MAVKKSALDELMSFVNDTASSIGSGIKNTAQNVGNYFNPNVGVVQQPRQINSPTPSSRVPIQIPQVRSFWTDIPQVSPKFNSPGLGNVINNFVGDTRTSQLRNAPVFGGLSSMAGDLIKTTLNSPSELLRGGAEMQSQMARQALAPTGLTKAPTTQEYLGTGGKTATAALNLLPLTKWGELIPTLKAAGSAGFLKSALTGAVNAGAFGGVYSFLNGLDKNRNMTIGDQLKQSGLEGLVGLGAGAAFGTGLGLGGTLISRLYTVKPTDVFKEVKIFHPEWTEKQARGAAGRWIAESTLGKNTPVEYINAGDRLSPAEVKALNIKYGLEISPPGLTTQTLTKEEGEALRKISDQSPKGVGGGGITELPKELNNALQKVKANLMPKQDFVDAVNKINNKTVNTFLSDNKMTPGQFYDKYARGDLSKIKQLEEQLRSLRTVGADLSQPEAYGKVYNEWKSLKYSTIGETPKAPVSTPPPLNQGGQYLYHGTNEDVLSNIAKEGLKPGQRGVLSLSKDEAYARSFAREGMTPQGKTNAVNLRVNTDLLKGKTMPTTSKVSSDQLNEILTKETIPPEALEIYKNGQWVPLRSAPLNQGGQLTPKENILANQKLNEDMFKSLYHAQEQGKIIDAYAQDVVNRVKSGKISREQGLRLIDEAYSKAQFKDLNGNVAPLNQGVGGGGIPQGWEIRPLRADLKGKFGVQRPDLPGIPDKLVFNTREEAKNYIKSQLAPPPLNQGAKISTEATGVPPPPKVEEVAQPTVSEQIQMEIPQPKGLKTPIYKIPTDELITRSKSSSRFKDAYNQELTRRGVNPENPLVQERQTVEKFRQNELNRPGVQANVKGIYDVTTDEGRLAYGEDLLKSNPALAKERMIKEPLSNETVAIADAVHKDYSVRADAAEKAGNTAEAYALDKEESDLMNKFFEKVTPAAQAFQLLHVFSQKSPQGMLRWARTIFEESNKAYNLSPVRLAKRVLGKDWEMTLKPAQEEEILSRMRQINKISDPVKQKEATLQLMRDVVKPIPPSVLQYTDAYRYQNMLINPLTQLRNIYHNLKNAIVLRPATIAASGHPVEAAKYYVNLVKGFPGAIQGLKRGLQGESALSNKYGDTSVKFGSYNTATETNMPIPLTVAGRALEGADQFFTELIANAEYMRLSSRGVTNAEAKKQAYDLAARYLYRQQLDPTNSNGQGLMLSKIDGLTKWIVDGRKYFGPLGWFVPFVRVPMAVAKATLEYNPITGPATMIGANNKAEQLGKAMIGGVVMAIGASVASQGKTTWAAPNDPEQKKLFYDSGRKPFSVLVKTPIGEAWVPYTYFGELGLGFALPAAVKYYTEESKTALSDSDAQKLFSILTSSLNYFSQTTPMSGLGGFVRTASGDVDYNTATNLAFTSGQLVPLNGLVTYIANLIDPVYRDAKTFSDTFKKNIPFLSTEIKPILNSAGQPATRNLSNYIFPYGVGIPNNQYENAYKERGQTLQQNNLINTTINKGQSAYGLDKTTGVANQGLAAEQKLKKQKGDITKLMDTYYLGDNEQVRSDVKKTLDQMGISFEDANRMYMLKDEPPVAKSLGPVAQQKLERSNDFKYIRKLRDTYDGFGLADNFLNDQYQKLNIAPDVLAYDDKTLLPDDLQLDQIKTETEGLTGNDLLSKLVTFRVVSEGSRKPLLTDTLIGKLEDQGAINKDTAAYLKKIGWNAEKQAFELLPGQTKTIPKSFWKINIKAPKPVKISRPKLGSGLGKRLALKTTSIKPPVLKVQPTQIRYSATPKVSLALRTPVKNLSQLGRV